FDFRDAFGAVWALRVMERINQAGRQATPPIELTWHGFEVPPSQVDVPETLAVNIRATLRRFVPPEWLADHEC
ncbi:MAG: hypothetical protein KDA92_10900, partial [Planctomycetales bacterium]|nr:hypothetical protein [Planctomycetales bacterium]